LFAARSAAQNIVGNHAAVPGMANADSQAVEAVVVAEAGNHVAQTVVAAVAAAGFQADMPGSRSSSSWATSMAVGGILKNVAMAPTARPERFM
jgi:hypothetical protein